MNNALMNAILSMDAYNRGYNASVELIENQVGTATILATVVDGTTVNLDSGVIRDPITGERLDDNIGFYALAYDYDGETIIAYRGTDDTDDITLLNPVTNDMYHGWSLGTGNLDSEQGQMAIDFYNEVVDVTNTHITLTGHSLGGGLAGFVAAISEQPDAVEAIIFDSMDYENAASALVDNYDDIYIGAYRIEGEFLSGTTPFSPDDPSIIVNVDIGDKSNLGSVDRHSQATLVIGLYAQIEIALQTDWKEASLYMWDVLYDHAFAGQIGFEMNINVSGDLQTDDQYADILRTVIAYSAIDEGERPFGDTGIRALYDDANDLGSALNAAGVGSTIQTYATDISKTFVQFAGMLALNKIIKSGDEDPIFVNAHAILTH